MTSTWNGMRYLECGPENPADSTTFLLLHGLGGALEFWSTTVPVLGKSWRTIAVDIPGFGKSRKPAGKLTLDSMAGDLAAFCRARGVDHAVLVSHSIGGAVAARLATRLPDVFERVVFVSGSLLLAAKIVQNPLRGFRTPKVGVAVAAQFLAGMAPVPKFVQWLAVRSPLARRVGMWPFAAHPERLPAGELASILSTAGSLSVLRILLTARSINYVEALDSVPQPVGLVWGASDRLITRSDVLGMRQLMDVQRELEIADCGHWPMVEKFDDVLGFLTTWGLDEL